MDTLWRKRHLLREVRPAVVGLLFAAGVAGVAYTGTGAAPRAPVPLPKLAETGSLAFEILDADTEKAIPGKLTLVGTRGSKDPALSRGDIGREEEGAVAAFNRVFSATGLGVLRVPSGTYDVYVSRGPEWESQLFQAVRVGGPRGAEVRARLRHVIDTPGWLSADFHVHASASSDSRVPMRDRVYEFVADGVDMIVSTDHNVVSDYAPHIAEIGVGDLLANATGDEVTTGSWGHFGAFPLPHDLEEAGHGAVLARGRTAGEIFGSIRRSAPGALINVHHPRLDAEIGYFNLGRFDSQRDEAERPGFSFDFDAVEVLNGYQDPDRRSVDRVVADFFALIDHGHLVTATGNSDTHHMSYNLAGYPRNYVLVPDDHPSQVRPSDVAQAVKDHHAFFTTGPFVRFTVGKGQIGDLVPASGGAVVADVEVSAPSWIDVSRVMVYVNGVETKRWVVDRTGHGVRLQERLEIKLAQDSYAVVRVDGDRPMAPVVGDMTRFEVRPFALTNPIFLDANGNGKFDAPKAHGGHVRATPAP